MRQKHGVGEIIRWMQSEADVIPLPRGVEQTVIDGSQFPRPPCYSWEPCGRIPLILPPPVDTGVSDGEEQPATIVAPYWWKDAPRATVPPPTPAEVTHLASALGPLVGLRT